jgi:hypothetical protein
MFQVMWFATKQQPNKQTNNKIKSNQITYTQNEHTRERLQHDFNVVCNSVCKLMIIPHVSLDRHASARQRAANRSAWKQSQCVASGQTTSGGGQQYSLLARSNSAFSHSQQSSVSISSGSVSSIASSLTAGGSNGKKI